MPDKVQITISIEGVGAEAIDLANKVLGGGPERENAATELALAVLAAAREANEAAAAKAARNKRTFGYAFEQTIVTCKVCGKDERDVPEGETQKDCEHDYDYAADGKPVEEVKPIGP